MANQTAEEKYELITRGLQEVLGGDLIKAVLAEGRNPKCYWGKDSANRTTGNVAAHIGYYVPLTKIADFLNAGVEVTILLADVHAFLDNLKAPLDLVAHRTKYYKFALLAVFRSLGIPTTQLRFVEGSSYQLTKEYNLDNYRLCATVTEHDAKKAGAEVVKQVDSPLLSGLLYPGLQALDEQYLGVDFQFGGVDQRKIFTFAELYLPRLGYAKRAHLMNAMVPSLEGGKMSASNAGSKIDLLDSPEIIAKKIRAAYCKEGDVEENPVLAFCLAVLVPLSRMGRAFVSEDAPEGTVFTIVRSPKAGGGASHYASGEALRNAFAAGEIHPGDLKSAVADAIQRLLAPVRKEYEENEEWQETVRLAYPDLNANVKKKKKEKVYHPPPPGKGKNATKAASTPTEAVADAAASAQA